MSFGVAAEIGVERGERLRRKGRAPDPPREPLRLPHYAVVIDDDDFHSYPYLIDVLRKVCGHDRRRAYQLSHQVHFHGRAAVWVGPLEHAELKRDLIRDFGPDLYAREPVTFPLSVRVEPCSEG